jgi:hypothetical protein
VQGCGRAREKLKLFSSVVVADNMQRVHVHVHGHGRIC